MHQADYIGYRKSVGDIASSGLTFISTVASSGAKALASGGADISADIALIASSAVFASQLWNQWTSHPAADARDFIANLKPKLASADPYNRLLLVMAGDTKINHRAKDVSAKELVLWYRGNYANDYLTLTPDAKTYWNNYLVSAANGATDVNQASRDYISAKFTTYETNYNANPVQAASNILTNITSGKTNWVLYGAIALGVILLLKRK
jgi:hypothetical protein